MLLAGRLPRVHGNSQAWDIYVITLRGPACGGHFSPKSWNDGTVSKRPDASKTLFIQEEPQHFASQSNNWKHTNALLLQANARFLPPALNTRNSNSNEQRQRHGSGSVLRLFSVRLPLWRRPCLSRSPRYRRTPAQPGCNRPHDHGTPTGECSIRVARAEGVRHMHVCGAWPEQRCQQHAINSSRRQLAVCQVLQPVSCQVAQASLQYPISSTFHQIVSLTPPAQLTQPLPAAPLCTIR